MPQTDIATVILTGGKSSRMGKNKALLPWRGVRLVDFVAGIVKESGINDIYISGKIDGYICIPDLFSDMGPVGGVYSSIESLHQLHTKLLFLPVDMPLISADFIRYLIQNSHGHEVCYFEGNPLPCVLNITKNVKEQIRQLHRIFEDGKTLSVKKYMSNLNELSIAIPDKYISNLTNTNTPKEWQEAGA